MTSIRKATPNDLNALSELLIEQFLEHDIELAFTELYIALTNMLDNEKLGFCLLAEKDGQPIGFAAISFAWTLEYGGKTAWLDELYILPDERNAGIGEKIVDAVIAEAKALDCKAIDLEVAAEHQRAEHLYRRKGFLPLNRRRWVKELS